MADDCGLSQSPPHARNRARLPAQDEMEELTVRERKMIPLLSIVAWAILSGSLTPLATAETLNKVANPSTRIAFVQANAQTPGGDIYTMDPDGTNVRQLTNLGAGNGAGPESWSADGRQI